MYSVFPQAAGIFNYKVQANKCGICEMVRASNCIQHPSKGRTHGKFENNHPVHLRMPRPITKTDHENTETSSWYLITSEDLNHQHMNKCTKQVHESQG